MDSTTSVHSGAIAAGAGINNNTNTNANTTTNAKKGNNRRGSNPSNLNNPNSSATTGGGGNESGITSPRGEAVGAEQANNPAGVAASKRRPSISSAPPRPTRPQNSANVPPPSTATDPTKNVSLFAHLPQVATNTTSPTASITAQLLKSGKEASIHPAIIKLGLAFADYSVMGAAERCRQMLLAFKQVKESRCNGLVFNYFI